MTRGLHKLDYFMRFYPNNLRLSLTSGHKMSTKSPVIGADFWIIYILMPFFILFLESSYKLWLVINICELKLLLIRVITKLIIF